MMQQPAISAGRLDYVCAEAAAVEGRGRCEFEKPVSLGEHRSSWHRNMDTHRFAHETHFPFSVCIILADRFDIGGANVTSAGMVVCSVLSKSAKPASRHNHGSLGTRP